MQTNVGQAYTVIAGADLSGLQYYPVTNGGVLATIGLAFHGTLQNKPQSGEHATVITQGRTKAVCGVVAAAGILLTTQASGFLIAVTSGQYAVGKVITAAPASGDIGDVHLFGAPVYVNSY